MIKKNYLLVLGGTALGCLIVAGWGSSASGTKLTGTVTFDDVPVKQGFIRFIPQDGPATLEIGAPISDGKYRLTVALTEGGYRVEIDAYRPLPAWGSGPGPADLGLAPGMEQFLPTKFNRQSTLVTEVTWNNDPILTFDLQSD